MIVFYDPGHSVHNPEREYTSGGAIPYPECADRAHGIGAALKEAGFTLQPPPPCAPSTTATISIFSLPSTRTSTRTAPSWCPRPSPCAAAAAPHVAAPRPAITVSTPHR